MRFSILYYKLRISFQVNLRAYGKEGKRRRERARGEREREREVRIYNGRSPSVLNTKSSEGSAAFKLEQINELK